MEVSKEAEHFPGFSVGVTLGGDWLHHPRGGGEMSHLSLAMLQLVLLLLSQWLPLPVFPHHEMAQVRSKQGEGHSGHLSLYSQSWK